MGTTTDQLDVISQMYAAGHLPPRARVADFGCQQLYGGTPGKVAEFLRAFGREAPDSVVTQLASEGAFIGHIFAEAGFRYVSFDIVEAPFCEYFDLNVDSVPAVRRNTFDLVLNFGTTEHVMNQYNAFKALHDSATPGGLIYSYFIRAGHMEHGLVHYSDRFVDLWCQANAYEALWRYDHDKPNEECTWLVVKRPTDAAFQAVVDVQEGEDLPRLRKRA